MWIEIDDLGQVNKSNFACCLRTALLENSVDDIKQQGCALINCLLIELDCLHSASCDEIPGFTLRQLVRNRRRIGSNVRLDNRFVIVGVTDRLVVCDTWARLLIYLTNLVKLHQTVRGQYQ